MDYPKYIAEVKSRYPKAVYHGFEPHVGRVIAAAEKLIETCARHGIVVNSEALLGYAIPAHDMDLHQNFRLAGYSSAEQMSAEENAKLMAKHGANSRLIEQVQRIIMATNPMTTPETPEEIIIRSADLSSLSGDFSHYREDFERLLVEYEANDERQFFVGNLAVIARYFWPQLHLTPEYYDGSTSSWHLKVASNIIENYRQICLKNDSEPVVVVDLGTGANPIVHWQDMGESLVFGVEPQDDLRRFGVSIGIHNRTGMLPELIAPGFATALPLPAGSVDRIVAANLVLHYPEAISALEISRVVRDGGKVEVLEWLEPSEGYRSLKLAQTAVDLQLTSHFRRASKDDLPEMIGYGSDRFRLRYRKGTER